MAGLLRISDAATLGIHALALLASAEEPVQVSRLAGAMIASEAHLSKVLQRLAKQGMVSSVRGPRGGFVLRSDPAEVSLLDAFVAVDGPLGDDDCLLIRPACGKPGECAVCALNAEVRHLVVERLGGVRLADLDLSELLE